MTAARKTQYLWTCQSIFWLFLASFGIHTAWRPFVQRRNFLQSSLFAGAAPGQAQPTPREFEAGGTGSTSYRVPLTIERRQAGKPHRGKVLAAIQPHCDDIPI